MIKSLRKSALATMALAVAVATVLVASVYLSSEIRWDRGWKDSEDLYRVHVVTSFPDRPETEFAVSGPGLAGLLAINLADVGETTRARVLRSDLRRNGDVFSRRVAHVDRNFLRISGARLETGDAAHFERGRAVALGPALAEALVGGDRARALVGETIEIEGAGEVTVIGILAPPGPTHLDVAAFVTGELSETGSNGDGAIVEGAFFTYLRLAPGAGPDNVQARLDELGERILPRPEGSVWDQRLVMRGVRDIHLMHTVSGDVTDSGHPDVLIVIALVVATVLALAAVNFLNLSIIRTLRDLPKIGLKKVLGANYFHIFTEYLKIYAVQAGVATAIGVILAAIFVHEFGILMETSLTPDMLIDPVVVSVVLVVVALLALSGILFPLLFAAGFRPAACLEGRMAPTRWAALRGGIITAQFAAVVVLGTLVVVMREQVRFSSGDALGYRPGALEAFVIPVGGNAAEKEDLLAEIARLPGIEAVAGSWLVPGVPSHSIADVRPTGVENARSVSLSQFSVSPGFLATYGIDLLAGRDFLATRPAVPVEAAANEEAPNLEILLNETAARAFGFSDPADAIGLRLGSFLAAGRFRRGEVVGIVRDFRIRSAREPVMPTAMLYSPSDFQFLTVAPVEDVLVQARQAVKESIARRFPGSDIGSVSIPELVRRDLREVNRQLLLLEGLVTVTLVVAAIGLSGLSLERVHACRREVAIRRVYGASSLAVVRLLIGRTAMPVVIGVALALPLAVHFSGRWLERFVARIEPEAELFLTVALFTIFVAVFLACAISLKAVRASPARDLNCER